MAEFIYYTYQQKITCPYCGFKIVNSCDKPNTDTVECSKCGKKYEYKREFIVGYNSFMKVEDV